MQFAKWCIELVDSTHSSKELNNLLVNLGVKSLMNKDRNIFRLLKDKIHISKNVHQLIYNFSDFFYNHCVKRKFKYFFSFFIDFKN